MRALRAVHLTPKRLSLIIVIAIIAAGATAGLILQGKAKYKAQTTVFVAQGLGGLANNTNVTSAGDFQAALKLPAVLNSVSASTGVSVAALKKVTASQAPSSSAVVVSYTNTNQATAVAVVNAISTTTLTALDQATSPQDWNMLFLCSPEFMYSAEKSS